MQIRLKMEVLQCPQMNDPIMKKIQEKFSNDEKQQEIFKQSYTMFLRFKESNGFIIDLDNVWKLVGFSTK